MRNKKVTEVTAYEDDDGWTVCIYGDNPTSSKRLGKVQISENMSCDVNLFGWAGGEWIELSFKATAGAEFKLRIEHNMGELPKFKELLSMIQSGIEELEKRND